MKRSHQPPEAMHNCPTSVHSQMADNVTELYYLSILIFHWVETLNSSPKKSSLWRVGVSGQEWGRCVGETWCIFGKGEACLKDMYFCFFWHLGRENPKSLFSKESCCVPFDAESHLPSWEGRKHEAVVISTRCKTNRCSWSMVHFIAIATKRSHIACVACAGMAECRRHQPAGNWPCPLPSSLSWSRNQLLY